MSRSFILFLCLFLSVYGQAQNVNSSNLLKQLLDLPAPPIENSTDNFEIKEERPQEFYSYETIPADDAPMEDLLDYWAYQNSVFSSMKYSVTPSEKTLERLLEYCEDNPARINEFLSILPTKPDIAEKVKQIYDRMMQSDDASSYLRNQIKGWLKYNSKYYLDEVIKEAQTLADTDEYVSGTGKEALIALGKIDWDSAKPILERLENNANQPNSAIVAKWVLYRHALDTGDESAAERYRGELKKIVENKSATSGQRDLAMDSLVLNGDWQGRDEWYVSLLEDETLLKVQGDGYTGLTTLVTTSPPKKWLDTMVRLTKSPSFAVRSAAARNLMEVLPKDRKDVLEALLPWLSNPRWAEESDDNERYNLMSVFSEVDFPQAIPGLIWIVQNESHANRGAAAVALIKYKDARAIPALRFALQDEKDDDYRKNVIEALIACGGMSDDEQMASLEAFAALSSTAEGLERIEKYESEANERNDDEDETKTRPTLPLNVIVGKFLAAQDEPTEGLAARAIERVKVLRKTKPDVAKTLSEIIKKWKGRVIYMEALRQIKTAEADVDTVLNLLANRRDARAKIPNEIVSLRTVDGTPRGIGACLAEDAGEFSSILNQAGAETQIAALSCARMIRAALPLGAVGALLKSENNLLALAAERYLQAEDSVQARTLVLSRHANEAVILGARHAFVPPDVKNAYVSPALSALFSSVTGRSYMPKDIDDIQKAEENLRAEIREKAELQAIYAFLPEAASGQQIIRVYKNRVVYTVYEDRARYWEKDLTREEYDEFYKFLIANNVDGITGYDGDCETCQPSEFVMFGKNGGRRVFMGSSYNVPDSLKKLRDILAVFGKGEMKLHYYLSDKIKNLEVLLADQNLNAVAVWKKDADLGVLIEDKAKKVEIENNLAEQERVESLAAGDAEDQAVAQSRYEARTRRRKELEFAHFSWRRIEGGKLGGVLPQPSDAEYLPELWQVEVGEPINQVWRLWQARAGNSQIRTGNSPIGLYRVSRGQTPVKIREGYYSAPVVTPDGKWVVAAKYDGDWNQPSSVSRINLETAREFPINLPPANIFMPVAYISAQNKMLLFRARGKIYRLSQGNFYIDQDYDENEDKPNPSPKVPEYYLLDVETGAVELVKGEFRPLEQQTYRRLQPTAVAGEFWAAIYDEKTKTTEIGRYSEKTFAFQPVLKLPDIYLNSMQIWVDEREAKVYFVYQGHLLAAPLK